MRVLLVVYLIISSALGLFAQEVSTVAGSGTIGSDDGPALEATFNNPHGIAVDVQGNIYVSDRYGHTIRKISSNGTVTTLAGSGSPGNQDGTGAVASFNEPWDLCIGLDGNIYVADTKNNLIRKVTPQGVVTSFAGNGNFGIANGPAGSASFGHPTGISCDSEGNFYIADHSTHIIRKISTDGTVSHLAGVPLYSGFSDGFGDDALFNRPYGITIDASGNIIVADEWNHAIRSVTPLGEVSTIAGTGNSGHDDGAGGQATFHYPWDVAADDEGNIYVMDGLNHVVRKIMPSSDSPPTYGVLTFAGTSGESGSEDGYGPIARFNGAAGVHCDHSTGAFYIADTYNSNIRKIDDFNEQSILLNINSNAQGAICNNEPFVANAYPANFETYVFIIDGQIVQSDGNEFCSVASLSAGTHTMLVHGVNALGTFTSDESSFEVIDAPKPTIEVDGELPMPEGSAVVLSTGVVESCIWSTGETTEFIALEEPAVVTVDALFSNGCRGISDPVNVQQLCTIETPLIEYASGGATVDCVFGNVELITDYVGDIQWLKNGVAIPGATATTYEATENGVYQLMATAYGQNVYSNTLLVTISEVLLYNITSNKTVVSDHNPKIHFTPLINGSKHDYTFEWNFGDFNSGADNYSDEYKPKHTYSGVGTYDVMLKVTNIYSGCSQTMYNPEMITVYPGFDDGEDDDDRNNSDDNALFIPNAFSPNDDGENDILRVRGEEIADLEFQVYNKKGQLVFECKNQSEGWDGLINGQPASNETYNYIVKAKMQNGKSEIKKGKVFLIR